MQKVLIGTLVDVNTKLAQAIDGEELFMHQSAVGSCTCLILCLQLVMWPNSLLNRRNNVGWVLREFL